VLFDAVVEVINPARSSKVARTRDTLAKFMGVGRVHESPALHNVDELAIAVYMAGGLPNGMRASAQYTLDWSDTRWHAGCDGHKSGWLLEYLADKDNRVQEKRVKALECTSTCPGRIARDAQGKMVMGSFCPAHLKLLYKEVLAAKVGVSAEDLKGPVFGEYCKLADVTLRMRTQMRKTNVRLAERQREETESAHKSDG